MELRLRGLDGPVEIMRDRFGVPHCWAPTEHDAFFAQGYMHAADRLWQMDYDRRRGLGRAAEVIGATAVPSDVLYRRLDLAASAQSDLGRLSRAARDMLTAYTAGVNAVIHAPDLTGEQARRPPPAEFARPGARLQPWEPWHSLVVYRVRHLAMGSAAAKLWRAVVSQTLGQAAASMMVGGGSAVQVACVPPGERCAPQVPAWTGPADAGSNNWALAGSRTASGLPLLAGDPHRPLEVPNVYVQGHVSCPDWDVLGLSIPGVPGFSHFGHNASVAWCITHAMADDQDLYQFTDWPSGSAGRQRTELIEVRDGEPVRIEARDSDRGPLVTPELALAWAATAAPNTGFDTLPVMLRARSVGELFESMAGWVEPVNNLLAADRDGSIGYLTRGRVPVRSGPEAAWLPVPATDVSYGWRGFVAFADMPHVRDPDGGFLFSANNRILAADSGPYLGLDVAAPWRATRIAGRLSALTGATVDDMAELHRDVVSLPARRIARLLGDWAPLAGWDGQMDARSVAAAAYSVLRRELALIMLERSGLAAIRRASLEPAAAGHTSRIGGVAGSRRTSGGRPGVAAWRLVVAPGPDRGRGQGRAGLGWQALGRATCHPPAASAGQSRP